MPEPKEYKHIRAWGKMMGSFSYYIKDQQGKASNDNAPLDAIYCKMNPETLRNEWICFSQIENPHTRQEIDVILAHMR